MVFSTLSRSSLFSQPLNVNNKTEFRKNEPLSVQAMPTEAGAKSAGISGLFSLSLTDNQEIERAFHAIVAALRTLEIDTNMIESCLSHLSPAEREKILTHLQQLKRNKQKTHDLHYHYTEVCLASSQQHFTNGVTPRERQLADKIMKLRERIATLIDLCRALLTQYKLLGKVSLPKDCGKSLSAIKNLGNILTEVFCNNFKGGSFKYFAQGFKIEAEQTIYVRHNGEVYVKDVEQLTDVLLQLQQRLAQATEGKLLVKTQPTITSLPQLQVS